MLVKVDDAVSLIHSSGAGKCALQQQYAGRCVYTVSQNENTEYKNKQWLTLCTKSYTAKMQRSYEI